MSVASPVIDHLDASTKLIYLGTGIREYHPVDDIYKEVRNLRRLNENLRWFDMPISAFGAVPKGGGKYTPRYAQFNNGWKVVPEDTSHSLYISGEQITDAGESGPACLDTTVLSPGTNVIIHYEPPAAELIKAEAELAAIKRMAYNEKVAIDPQNSTGDATTSTDFPAGTRQAPALDIATALTIANTSGYNFKTLWLESDLSITDASNLNNFVLQGSNHVNIILQIVSAALVESLKIVDCTVRNSTLDGDVDIGKCIIDGIVYMNGHVHDCGLLGGTIQLGGSGISVIENCYTIDQDNPPTVDLNWTGNSLSAPNYSGILHLTNSNDPDNNVGIGLSGGLIVIDSTFTEGHVIIAGNGVVINNGGPNINLDTSALMNIPALVDAIMEYSGP